MMVGRLGVSGKWGRGIVSAFKIFDRGPTFFVAHDVQIQAGNDLAALEAMQVWLGKLQRWQ